MKAQKKHSASARTGINEGGHASRDSSSRTLAVWRVGFSGHRKLSDSGSTKAAIGRVWEQLQVRVDGGLEGYGSAADGADLIFAKTVLKAGAAWHVILPGEREKFRDEISDEWKECYDRVLSQATTCEELPSKGNRPTDYYLCGKISVETSDIFVAVWDGEPERGLGGTAGMINLARRRKMPLVWIHSETGATSWENFPEDVLRDKLADGLLRLGPPPTVPQIASANERLDVLLTWLDGFATGSGPRFRMLAVSSLVLHGLAIAAAVCGLVGWFSPIMSGAKFVLLFLAVCCAVYARYQQLHQQWIYPRVLAEMVRSLRFCHPLLSPSDLHGLWDAFPHFRRTLRGIHGKLSSGMIDPLSFPDSRRHYLDYRLNGQIRYYSQAAERTGTLLRWLNRLFQLLLVSAFVAASAYFIWKGVFLGVLTILLPLGSMVVLALKSALDLDGRYARFREIADDLSEIHGLLAAVEEPNAFVRGVLRVEKILLAEVAEWYQRNRHLQIH